MAVDVWLTFSKSFVHAGAHGKTSKRFRVYSIFSWATPALIVLVALMVEFLASASTFRPNYRKGLCWLTNKNALFIFFAAPLFRIIFLNTVLFVATASSIYRSKTSSARQLGNDDNMEIVIYVKLFLVMGLTWVVGFVAILVFHPVLWYMFIILNTLQGLFIFLSFVMTNRVCQLVRERVFGRQQRPASRTITMSSTIGSSTNVISVEFSTGTNESLSVD
ncbi:G-protein coupled receptor Mth2-like [Gigantopelta aegis]|uniref:G-protein coupled receptor Mth2-like n=1 Tax=Gigantopelta aegis TaxID=1735272 RepID=UPI001B88B3CB|nr:G-protein coupled receptor Mth2-like [Gigantopelta aegis]